MSETVLDAPIIRDVDRKFSWKKFGTIVACGAALFSDGYVNSSVGMVNTILKKLYKPVYKQNNFSELVSSIAFAGTVLGMLVFGYMSDVIGRKNGMIIATLIVLVFTALTAGSYYKGEAEGLIQMFIAWRFFTGVGIGAEYPTGSVAAAEKTEEMPKRFQHGPFVFVTNFAIDMGFVTSSFVAVVLTWICGEEHNRLIWRLLIGIGVVPCLIVLPFRLVMEQSKNFQKGAIKYNKIPYGLILKRYWFRLAAISIAWFIYDFISYPFGLYSSVITDSILGNSAPQWKSFGWATVIMCFYLPGSFFGACIVDFIGPKKTYMIGLTLQIVVGFIMSGLFWRLHDHIAAFCVVYGLFLTFGEMGPGDNLGLLASKSCATCVKGQFYGIAAAIGKLGAFAGTYAFPILQGHYAEPPGDGFIPDSRYFTVPFYLGSALGCVALAIIAFCISEREANCQAKEDEDFREYLAQNGFDLSLMGTDDVLATDELANEYHYDEKLPKEDSADYQHDEFVPAAEHAVDAHEGYAPPTYPNQQHVY